MKSKILAKRSEIQRRLEQIDGLLSVEPSPDRPHPLACDCAIMSRDETHHHKRCPYRMLRELLKIARTADQPKEGDKIGLACYMVTAG